MTHAGFHRAESSVVLKSLTFRRSLLGQRDPPFRDLSECDWVPALSRLVRERAALDAEEGRWLLRALRSAAHVHLGYRSFADYVERLFGYKPRSTQEKLRVAEALETLPAWRARSRPAP